MKKLVMILVLFAVGNVDGSYRRLFQTDNPGPLGDITGNQQASYSQHNRQPFMALINTCTFVNDHTNPVWVGELKDGRVQPLKQVDPGKTSRLQVPFIVDTNNPIYMYIKPMPAYTVTKPCSGKQIKYSDVVRTYGKPFGDLGIGGPV